MSETDSAPPRGDTSSGGAPTHGTLRVPAQAAYLELIGLMVKWFGRRAGFNDEQCYELEVAVDEAATNVIRHAYTDRPGEEMTIACRPCQRGLQVTIRDKGRPFDAEQGLRIAEEKRARDPSSGGMGLFLIEQFTDRIEYHWDEEDGNQITLTKHR